MSFGDFFSIPQGVRATTIFSTKATYEYPQGSPFWHFTPVSKGALGNLNGNICEAERNGTAEPDRNRTEPERNRTETERRLKPHLCPRTASHGSFPKYLKFIGEDYNFSYFRLSGNCTIEMLIVCFFWVGFRFFLFLLSVAVCLVTLHSL